MASGLPFDDFRTLLRDLPGPDEGAMRRAASHAASLANAPGAGGRLSDLASWIAGWSAKEAPALARPLVALFAGSHGVVSGSMDRTRARLDLAAAGGAAVNQVCAANDIGLKVFELAIPVPTGDITGGAALDEKACAATMAFGMEVLAGGSDLIGLGTMSPGATIVAAAISHGLFGGDPRDWTDEPVEVEAIAGAVAHHRSHLKDPLELLRRLGGREHAAIAGAILAARMERVPIVLDGFAACAAGAVLQAMRPDALDHCLAAQVEPGPGHSRLLSALGMRPLLDLGYGQAEGVPAALAIQIARSVAAIHSGTAVSDATSDPAERGAVRQQPH